MMETVSKGEYATSIQTGPPDRPDDPAKWHAPRLTEKETARRTGLTPDAMRELRGDHPLAFPKPFERLRHAFGSWKVTTTREYDEPAVMAWIDRVRTLAGKFSR